MNRYLKNITAFLLNNTIWIYLILFLFFSFLLNASMVLETIGNYLFYTGSLSLLYLPVLLFAFFRQFLTNKLPTWLLSFLWLLTFVAYPFFLFLIRDSFLSDLFPVDNYLHGNEDIPAFLYSFLLTVNAGILATELAILYNNHFLIWLKNHRWFQQFDLDKMILVLASLVIAFFTFWATVDLLETNKTKGVFILLQAIPLFAINLFQITLIILGYYTYYYVNKYYLIPEILSKKGMIYYGFGMVGFILITYPILVFLIRLIPVIQSLEVGMFVENTHPFAKDKGLIPFLIMFFSVPVIVAMQWFEQNSQIANLEKEKSATELNLLKQQINPHFFFNTLNNLYALSIVKDKQTPEVIMQLSELMRYVIYKGKEETVLLKEEIKYIEDYIQLQQIRLHKQLDFRFDKFIADEKLKIPPLLFITFVENAFKHGIEPAERDCFLHLSLKSDAKQVIFTCENSVEEKNTAPAGIGLQNLKKRMTLRFPNQHEIVVDEKANHFKATLRIYDFVD